MAHCCCAPSTLLAFWSAVTPSRSSRATIKCGNCQSQERPVNHLTDAGEQSLAWLSYQGKDGSKLLGEAEPYWTVCKMFTAQSRGSLNSESQLQLLFTTTFGIFCTEKLLECSLQNRQNWVFVQFVKKKEAQSFWSASNGLLLSHCWPVWQKSESGNTLKMVCRFSPRIWTWLVKFTSSDSQHTLNTLSSFTLSDKQTKILTWSSHYTHCLPSCLFPTSYHYFARQG